MASEQRVIFLPYNPNSVVDGIQVDAADSTVRHTSSGGHAAEATTVLEAFAKKGWRIVQITASSGSNGVYALMEKTSASVP